MCGIIGFTGDCEAEWILLEGLKRLSYRGYDSCGIATIDEGKLYLKKARGKVTALESLLRESHAYGKIGIGHTRWATHGEPSVNNAHPIKVGNCLIVHNGIIENYREIKEHLKSKGVVFTSKTDSEVIAHLVSILQESGKNLQDSLKEVLPILKGSYAIVALSLKEPDTLVATKRYLPLIVGRGTHGFLVSSDIFAISPFCKDTCIIQDHDVAVLSKGGIFILDGNDGMHKPSFEKLLVSTVDMEKKGFKHYLLKEIYEQPEAFANTLNSFTLDNAVNLDSILSLSDRQIENLHVLYLSGCGTAYHAACLGKLFFQTFAGIEAVCECASEFRFKPFVHKNSLGILISQSGETADTLAAARYMVDKNIPYAAITNVSHSSLARQALKVLVTLAGPEMSVASTKAFTTQICVLYILALWLGLKRRFIDKNFAEKKLEVLSSVPSMIDNVLNLYASIEKYALNISRSQYIVYLGRGILMPLALEGALKMKEIAYIHAEGYPAGEMKHGPIALVEPGVYVIALIDGCNHRQKAKMISGIEEMLRVEMC